MKMFHVKTNHVCQIREDSSFSCLPRLPPAATNYQKFIRFAKKLTLITESNPQSFGFFRSTAEIINERKKQIETRFWIIHPFSTFRLLHEIWMMFIFFVCLIYMPLGAAYSRVIGNHYPFQIILSLVCWFDILINFRTGFVKTDEEIVMEQSKIAKHYILGPYFICDVLSSLPHLPPNREYFVINDVINYLGLLKIVRFGTWIKYTNRSFDVFKIQGLGFEICKVLITLAIVTHYFNCMLYWMPTIFDPYENIGNGNFGSKYVAHFFKGAAYLLGIFTNFPNDLPWIAYLFVALTYFVGKIICTFATVIALNMLETKHALENKYHEMMSQVDAFMTAKKIPMDIQKRVREYYHYKYREKYFKESSISKFISDRLKKEINYHVCRKLVHGVKIFENLPQNILEDILTYLKVEIYLTGDVIIQAGTEGDCMYFLASGTVAVSSPSGKEICHLEDGSYFGEISLVTSRRKRTASVIALEICEIYKLDRKSFAKCMEANKELHKKIQHEATQRLGATQEIEEIFMKERAEMSVTPKRR